MFVDPAKVCPKGTGGPVRLGSNIGDPPLLSHVAPAAPADPDVTGVVIIEAVVAADGTIARTKPLRAVAGLTAPAADAIAKWRYARTCLGGNPIQVVIAITLVYGSADSR